MQAQTGIFCWGVTRGYCDITPPPIPLLLLLLRRSTSSSHTHTTEGKRLRKASQLSPLHHSHRRRQKLWRASHHGPPIWAEQISQACHGSPCSWTLWHCAVHPCRCWDPVGSWPAQPHLIASESKRLDVRATGQEKETGLRLSPTPG